MITPVSHISGFWPSLPVFFELADSSGTSFLPQDSSWKKYATPALQVARLFSPGLDVALATGEVLETAYSGVSSGSDQAESHLGRNLLWLGGCALLLGSARFGYGRLRKYELLFRTSGGPTAVRELSFGEKILERIKQRRKILYSDLTHVVTQPHDPIYNCTIRYLEDLARANGYLKEAATQCLDGIKNGSITRFSQIDSILGNVKISAR